MDSEYVLSRRKLSIFLKNLVLLVLIVPAVAQSADVFERPESLKDDIAFWRQIFSEVSSQQALLHDSRYLGVIYEVVEIPENASPSRRRRIADLSRERYRTILKKFGAGERDNLNGEERRVLALWPEGTADAEFADAAKRIRFQQGLSDRFLAGLKRSGAWKPYIKEQLADAGVPIGLSALPHVESSFNPEARSHVGAAGLWQFTRSTGQRFMEIDHVIDERRDPFRSSESAAQLLAYNYSILESWPLAITAYNHGVAGMRRAVKKMGTEDMGVINREYSGRTFGFASRNFYVAFLAALEVEQNAEQYFGEVTLDSPRPELVFKSPSYIPAEALAESLGITKQQLKEYNPALLAPIWDGTKYIPRGYQVRVPMALVTATEQEVIAAIPAASRFAKQTPDMYHKVRRGESLSVIAARYDTSTRELVALNGLKSKHRIRIGQTLRLPFAGVAIPEGAETYTVKNGESLSLIAQRVGVSQASLMALNGLADENRIYQGQTLYLVAPVAGPAAEQAEVVALVEPPAGPAVASNTPDVSATAVIAEVEAVALEQTPIEVVEIAAEPASVGEAEAAVAAGASLADPNDYTVSGDNTIEVQASETLGHYAEWLDVKTQRLRDLNGLSYSKPVVVGSRIRLEFGDVTAQEFTAHRTAYHREMQEAFFVRYRVTATTEHELVQGESVWILMHRRYKVPVWLLRQYNPDLDFGSMRPGMRITFPQIEAVDQEAVSYQPDMGLSTHIAG